MGKGIGLKPSEFVEGGGLLDNVTAKIKTARFVTWDYGGKGPSSPALKLVLDVDGDEAEQYWSAGKADDWQPSKDGLTLVSIGSAKGLNKGSNLGIFLISIIEAGFPEDKLDDDCSIFEGMEAHFVRVPAPKRNVVAQPRADGKTFEQTILVVDKIVKMPWESKKTAGKATGKAAAATEAGTDVGQLAVDTVMELLAEAGGSVTKAELSKAVFAKMKTDPNRNAIVQMVYKDEWLGDDKPWAFDGKTISMV